MQRQLFGFNRIYGIIFLKGAWEQLKILVVEDTKDMNLLIVKTLKKSGYSVDSCYNGKEALDFLLGAEYDAILLDILMPKMNGYDFLKVIRSKEITTPVLFLTAKDAVEDKVKGLDLGADDYLVKPFNFDELLARIRAITRKQLGSRSNIIKIADLSIDTEQRTSSRGDANISLLPKEFTILEYLMRNAGIVLSREKIENQIWNYEYSGSSNNIDVYMSRLHKKIDGNCAVRLIHNIRGVGWVIKEEKA